MYCGRKKHAKTPGWYYVLRQSSGKTGGPKAARMTGYIFLRRARLVGQIDESFFKPTRNSKNKPPSKSN